jgi:ATP-binding cassette subfamily B multidrug efflux pump
MKSLLRMSPFVRPYRWVVFFLIITVILPVAMELIVPRALRYVIDQGIRENDLSAILRGAGFMLLTALVGALATLGQGVCRALLSQGLSYDMRNKMFSHIQTFSFANLDRMHTGQLMTRLSSDVDMVRMFVGNGLALLLRALLLVLGSTLLMFILDWQLALIMLILLPLAGILIWGVMSFAQPIFTLVQVKLSALNTIVQENLAGVQVVKAFVRERFEIDRFLNYNNDYMVENINVGRLMALALPIMTVLANLGIVAVIWFGGLSTINGRLSIGELVAFTNYLLIGMTPLMLLGNMLTMVSRAEASTDRIWELLDTQPVLKEPATPLIKENILGEVIFANVCFHYNRAAVDDLQAYGVIEKQFTGGKDVLEDVSFTVTPGQRVALLGATGSGKSTLVNLIPRFYDVNKGQILIDGIDVRRWDTDSLRKNIGMVLQQTTLFSGTVRENITFGNPDATIEEVIKVAKSAQAHNFIMKMPMGYDSIVEERGVNLSGGQKQRLAIARALLISPGILILDDCTSAIDMDTEAKIQGALNHLMRNCTTFIVAQRINSVLNADQILILDHGRISAQGTHYQLLESSPIYQEIYHSQLGNDRFATGQATS